MENAIAVEFTLIKMAGDHFFVIGELIVENAITIVYFVENENDLDDEFYA
ncbi:hypothetical protein [Plectonema radiosum]|nr:hypothetical protein [Plectonema radiosum]